ncbi:MAG: L-2-amino-thiazoline-4-carboxylic acid hydrolase, partial [Actinobacteria bacterium]|nr:L-2-amino-thiazoline-4-carboxylic acid hydrolase [Actinomycetota bacterium]
EPGSGHHLLASPGCTNRIREFPAQASNWETGSINGRYLMMDKFDALMSTPNDLKAERVARVSSGREVSRRIFLGKCGKWTGGILLTAGLGSLASCGTKDNSTGEQDRRESDYYLEQKDALLQQASSFSEELEEIMTPEYGREEAKAIAGDMVKRYDGMIGELPFIGGDKNAHMTDLLIHASTSMAFCLSMKEHRKSIDDAGRINYDAIEKYYRENPLPPDQKYEKGNVEKKRREQEGYAKMTQKREYPYNWVSFFVGDVPEPYIYGVNNIECGNLKLCNHYGILEFTNYLCMLDNILYPARGQGLTRTKTLAGDFELCDFRFSDDGAVELKEPFTVNKLREWGKVT